MGGLLDLRRRRDARKRARQDKKKVAFVLSGGGNLGAVQVGMLRALLERGIRPDVIVGCSVGAINGAALADDPSLVGVARLEQVWRGLDGNDLMPRSVLPNAVAMARKGEAIHDNDGLRQMLTSAMHAHDFAELSVHFECVATDIDSVREVWFSEGPLVEAILASSAMPALYPAVEIDGVHYLDGAIVNDVPLSRAVELGATTMYVLQVGSFSRPREKPRRPLDVAVQAYWIARHHRYKRDLDNLPPSIELHLLPHGQPPLMRYNDFTRTPELISTAYEASGAYLQALGQPRRSRSGSGVGTTTATKTGPPAPPTAASDNVLA